MEDEAPDPECVCCGDGDEKEVVVNKRVKPVNAADESIEKKMKESVGENDRSDDPKCTMLEREARNDECRPNAKPK